MCPALRGSTVSYAGDTHFPKHSLEYSLNFWSRSKKKKKKKRFHPQWQIGRPWLQFANGVMYCIACREFPQPGMHPSWQIGTTQLR